MTLESLDVEVEQRNLNLKNVVEMMVYGMVFGCRNPLSMNKLYFS